MTDQFPAGLRVLVVDDDRTCLAILEKMLLRCAYHVTTCGTARVALAKLRENRQCYDLVISDVYMPDMDGFKLLELVGLEMDLPVIMMSADGETSVVMKGITHGACDYLIKPIRMKELRNIWQHVIRKKRNVIKDMDVLAAPDQRRRPEEGEAFMSGNPRKRKEAKEEEEEEFDTEESTTLKKPRVVWSVELHQQFVTAVNQLGIDKAVPKRILELMHVQGLTRENVASHLQKYRLYLKRLSLAQQQNAISMTTANQPTFDVLPSHPVIPPGSSQTLAAIQSAYLARSNGLGSGAPAPESQQSVFVMRSHISQANNQRSLFPPLHDSEQLTKPPQVPSLGQATGGLHDAAVADSNLLPAAVSSGLDESDHRSGIVNSLTEQLLHQQKQVTHYVQKPEDACVQHSVLQNPPALLDGMPGEIAKPPAVKCEPDAALNRGWNFRSGWNTEPDMLQTAVTANYSMSNRGDRQNYVTRLLAPSPPTVNSNGNLKVKTEQLPYEVTGSGVAAPAPVLLPVPAPSPVTGAGFLTAPEQIVDDLSSICYKQESHDSGFFYSDSLGLEGYVHGNLYVK